MIQNEGILTSWYGVGYRFCVSDAFFQCLDAIFWASDAVFWAAQKYRNVLKYRRYFYLKVENVATIQIQL